MKENSIVAIVKQSSLPEEKANLMITNISTYINQINEWQAQNQEIEVNSVEQKAEMKQADLLRKSIKKERTIGEKYFKSQRTDVQKLMADYKAEDTIWLRISQKFEELCKNIESDLELKATFAERIEAGRKQKLLLERTEILAEYSNNPRQYNLEHLTDEAFNELLNGLKLQYQARIEAEQRAARETKLYFEREREMSPFSAYFANIADFNFCEFGKMSDSEYNDLKLKVQGAKEKSDKERAEIEAENKRLKEESDNLKREAFEKDQAEKARLRQIEIEKEAELQSKLQAAQAPDKEKLLKLLESISTLNNSINDTALESDRANMVKNSIITELNAIISKHSKLTNLL